MSFTRTTVVAVSFACSACGPLRDSTAPAPIFRSVQVASGVVRLGEPLADEMGRPEPGDSLVSLATGSLRGASALRVLVGSGGIVRAVTIDYDRGADFEAMVASHTASLGAPERSAPRLPGEEPADVAVWRDGATELRLIRDPNRSAWTVRAVLTDLSGQRR